ncbi:MarR family winged helix-turn-helix transcriptional regulator [Intrasporangium sp.]|uniref:MarR family winged helix-turn-helix transcriptional regulator n=1 Tax=Intrasporangium sp. TaxID=1925024 RepID=UPI00293AF6F3|nr:MarR family winged helix-turn-helix transcriptional regulator [Intrasporangium sp.]MDV3221492.1 MarR family winged helix-turn-helix transcriptional regulator [Intrasporangium sp.]
MKGSPPRLADSVTFRLGTLGILALARLAPRLELHDLKPKHLGMLALLDSVEAGSQLEVARAMNIAPSLVVALADHLEDLGAIQRVRDPEDRRRHVLRLTDRGRDLLQTCTDDAYAIDADLTAELSPADRADLARVLGELARGAGLPALPQPSASADDTGEHAS